MKQKYTTVVHLHSSTARLRTEGFDCDRSYHRQTDLSTVLYWGLHPSYSFQFHHHVACFTTSPLPLSKRVLYTGGSSVSSNFQSLLIFSRSSSSCLSLLHRLFIPHIFPSTNYIRTHFLRKMWPNQSALLHFTLCRLLLSSSTLYILLLHLFLGQNINLLTPSGFFTYHQV